ncbi:cobalamin biosynthesis protein, partial [Chloroflexota bacterium]
MDILFIVPFALAIDLALGDPPSAFHPVAWMGKVISLLEKGSFSQRPSVQFVYGVGMTLVTMGIFTAPAYFILLYLKGFSIAAYI